MKQYVNYYGEETEKVPLPVAYHLEKGCGRINDTTRDGTIGSPDKPGGLSIQLCKSEKKEFYIRYSS